jgi:hypothetical protein
MNHFDGGDADSQATGSRLEVSDSLRKAMQARARETTPISQTTDEECSIDSTAHSASDR